MFDYNEFVTRNIGFVSEEEQTRLKNSRIFIPGVGGMGGTALACLARCGIEHFIISDVDVFEVSNLNRQIFSNMETMGKSKAESAKQQLLNINPQIQIQVYTQNWLADLDHILDQVDLVINGCDDVKATVILMRKAREKNKTVIDAFASTLPSVYVISPEDPRPEEMFDSPTRHLKISDITKDIEKQAAACEMEYVLTHSSTGKHVILKYAGEMITGKRKRMSLAPMVWMTGLLMSYEAIKIILNKSPRVDCRGVFFNPWLMKVERPLPPFFAFFRRFLVRIFLKKLAKS